MSDYKYSTPIQIRYSDFDMLGHINNATIVTYIEVARLYYFIEIGWTLEDISNVVAHLDISFKAPILPGNAAHCRVKTSSQGSKSFKMEYELYSPETKLVYAKAETTQVCIDKSTGKTVVMPERIKTLINNYEAND